MTDRSASNDTSRLFGLVLAVVIVFALYLANVVFIPLALAMLFAFILSPLVTRLERMRLGRLPSSCFVVGLTLFAVGSVSWIVVRQFAEVINQLPEYQSNIEQKLESLKFSRSATFKNATATVNQISRALEAPPGQSADPNSRRSSDRPKTTAPLPVEIIQTPGLPVKSVQSLLGFLLQALIVIVFTIFMLLRRENLRNRFISLVGPRSLTVTTQALDEAGERVSRYLRMQLAVNATYGTAIGIALHLIGIPGGLLWGLIVGFLRFLPYVGPPLGGIMPVLLSLALFRGWEIPLITFGVFVTVELITANVIEPAVYGSHIGVSPLALLVAAIFWTFIWGPIGLLLSTPLTVCLVVLGRHVPSLAFLSLVLGDEHVLRPEALLYQRLLATDQDEAEKILEDLLARKSLLEVYDDVLIPTLRLTEQERYRDQIDESTAASIYRSTREIIEDLRHRSTETPSENPDDPSSLGELSTPAKEYRLMCVPARDQTDELAGLMLAHVLEPNVHVTLCETGEALPAIISRLRMERPDAICISALPPFVISHARSLYREIKKRLPNGEIFIGLWNFSGDVSAVQKRIGSESLPVTKLVDAVQRIHNLRTSATTQFGEAPSLRND